MKIKKQTWKLYLIHLHLVEIRVAESKQNQFDSDSQPFFQFDSYCDSDPWALFPFDSDFRLQW